MLLSIPPDAEGDPVFDVHAGDLAALKNLEWVGYLSTTAVYGNHDGGWIDETLDHKMLLHRDDPVIPEMRRTGEPFVELDVNPTAENIARLIFDRAAEHGLPVIEVTLWETENSFAAYRPQGTPADAKPIEMRVVPGSAKNGFV